MRPEEVEVVGIDCGEQRPEAEKDDPIQRLTASYLDSLGGEVAEEVAVALDMASRPGKVCGDGTSSRQVWTPVVFSAYATRQHTILAGEEGDDEEYLPDKVA